LSFGTQADVDDFKWSVQRYKDCIQEFVSEQNDAAEQHRKAAEDAIDEWNLFAKYELR
jgi:hypothetical protein